MNGTKTFTSKKKSALLNFFHAQFTFLWYIYSNFCFYVVKVNLRQYRKKYCCFIYSKTPLPLWKQLFQLFNNVIPWA